MKLTIAFSLLFFFTHAYGEVFVCKDDNKTIYQDKQCENITIRKLDILPPPTPEERAQAEERLQRITEQSRQRSTAVEVERQQQEKNDIELEKIGIERRKLELLEKQAAAEQPVTRVYVKPGYRRLHKKHNTGDGHTPHVPNSRKASEVTLTTK
ncbi:MAG: hypothetical protein H0W85_04225 [Methylotenera sp.]|nr:hypothetical protein [Methylotenera sp.]